MLFKIICTANNSQIGFAFGKAIIFIPPKCLIVKKKLLFQNDGAVRHHNCKIMIVFQHFKFVRHFFHLYIKSFKFMIDWQFSDLLRIISPRIRIIFT